MQNRILQTVLMITTLAWALAPAQGVAAEQAADQSAAPALTAEQQKKLDEAERLNEQVKTLRAQGKSQAAIPLAKRALEIRQAILGNEHPDTATCLNNLGLLLQEQGDYAAARPYSEQAVKINRKVLGDENRETATSLNNLGVLLYLERDYAAARTHLEQALAINRRILGKEHPSTAVSLNWLGVLLKNQGDYTAARLTLEESLAINRKVLGSEHPETAVSLNNLGNLLRAQGDYRAARRFLEQSLAINQKVLGTGHAETATSLGNLGLLLQDQGDYAAARLYFDRALEFRQKTLGKGHLGTAVALNNLGFLLYTQGDYAAARPYYEQALAINKRNLGDEDPRTALALNNLAALLHSQGDTATARRYYEQALAIRRKVLGEEHVDTSIALNNLGNLLQEQGDVAAARGYLEQSLKIKRKILGDDNPGTATVLNNLFVLEAAQGNGETAAKFADDCRRGLRRHIARVLPALSEREQLLFLKKSESGNFHRALSLALAFPEDRRIADLSAGWLLNGKAVGYAALGEQALLARDLNDPQLAALARRLQEARRDLASLTLAIPRPGQEDAHRQALAKLTAQEDRLAHELASSCGRGAETDPWVDLSRVREALPAGSVLIDIARFPVFNFQAKGKEKQYKPSRYVAWIIPAAEQGPGVEQGDVQVVDLGPAEAIDAAVELARNSIRTAAAEDSLLRQYGEIIAEKQARDSLRQVADLVWRPLADKAGSAKELILSPDGALWLLPWSALPVTDDKVLLEAYPLRCVVSGRDLAGTPAAKLTHAPPALFADPDFDLAADKVRESIQAVLPRRTPDDQGQAGPLTSESALPPVTRLPSAGAEAQAITPSIARFARAEPQTYKGRYALESVFKQVQRPSLLVLSTHGFFLSDHEIRRDEPDWTSPGPVAALLTGDGKRVENPLLRCGLLLAGCNARQSTRGDDGILTGMEILGVDLRGTELVVLSACETGVGKVRNGEGVAGLRQAFQLAGAEAVVATLWQVPDLDSTLIMNDFFRNLADGQPRTEALRNAQLQRMQARRRKNGAAHPFFWAAWTLTGK